MDQDFTDSQKWFSGRRKVTEDLDIGQLKHFRELGKLDWGVGIDAKLCRRNTILRLKAAGNSNADIADAVGVTRDWVKRLVRYYKDHNPDPTKLRAGVGAAIIRKDAVLRMNAEGKGVNEIAKEVGLSMIRVQEIIREERGGQTDKRKLRPSNMNVRHHTPTVQQLSRVIEDPEDGIERGRRMTAFATLFPCLEGAEGVSPWNPDELRFWAIGKQNKVNRWQCIDGTVRFLLALWDPRGEGGRFDVMEAIFRWDAEHRKMFLTWAKNPWWPFPTDANRDSPWLPISDYVSSERETQ